MPALVRRRDLAVPLLAAAPLLAQAPPAAMRRTPEQELEAARQLLKQSREKLGAQTVPMDKEPAFAFRVY